MQLSHGHFHQQDCPLPQQAFFMLEEQIYKHNTFLKPNQHYSTLHIIDLNDMLCNDYSILPRSASRLHHHCV